MRVSRQEMANSRSKIIDEAARLFREKGIEKTSVSDVMNAAGLTHGGFYRHFRSKDELANAALSEVFQRLGEEMGRNVAEKGAERAVAEFVERYLSERHADNPGKGCPIAALAVDTGRKPDVFRHTMSMGIERLVNRLAEGLAGTEDAKRIRAFGLLNALVGSLVLARTAEDQALKNEILSAGCLMVQHYLGVDSNNS